MGIYNEYYKKYYTDVKNQEGIKIRSNSHQYRPNAISNHEYERKKVSGFPIFLNIFGKGYGTIFIVQAVIIIILIVGLIGTKFYPTTAIATIYNKGIAYIDTGIVKNDDEGILEVKAVFNDVKSFLAIDAKKEAYITENYGLPVDVASVTNIDLMEDKVVLTLKDDSYIRAAYSGTIKEVIKDEETTLLINHGDGIEIKYIGLDDVTVAKGDRVGKGGILGSTSENSEGNVTIEIFYMGSRLDPSKCFQFKKV